MKKFTFNRWTEISYMVILFGSCIQLVNQLYAVFTLISSQKAEIINVDYNIYKLTVDTTIEQFSIYILPTYVVAFILIIYVLQWVTSYVKHCRENAKDQEV